MVAPMVLDGLINGIAFQAYLDQVLVPELRPDNVAIMDNLSSHKGAGVRAAIEAAGAILLYLPSYSPEFNLIENAFAKLKASLRRAAKRTDLDGQSDGRRTHASIPSPHSCSTKMAMQGTTGTQFYLDAV